MWNAQGCGHSNFIRVTRQYLRDHSSDIIGFVETRISNMHDEKVIVALNFHFSFRVEAGGFSGAYGSVGMTLLILTSSSVISNLSTVESIASCLIAPSLLRLFTLV
ncbi:hypothetical protein V6N13_048962 [Hibiscus sabdariffa]